MDHRYWNRIDSSCEAEFMSPDPAVPDLPPPLPRVPEGSILVDGLTNGEVETCTLEPLGGGQGERSDKSIDGNGNSCTPDPILPPPSGSTPCPVCSRPIPPATGLANRRRYCTVGCRLTAQSRAERTRRKRRRRTTPRSRTTPRDELRRHFEPLSDSDQQALTARPRTVADCPESGPCPWVACKYHVYLDVTEAGSIKINFPNRDPLDIAEPCVLRIARTGGVTLEETAQRVNLTRERVRQIEVFAIRQLKRRCVIEPDAGGTRIGEGNRWTSKPRGER